MKRTICISLFVALLSQWVYGQMPTSAKMGELTFFLADSLTLSVGDEGFTFPVLSLDGDRLYLMDEGNHIIHSFSLSGERVSTIPFGRNTSNVLVIAFNATMNRFLLFNHWHSVFEFDPEGNMVKEHKLKLGMDPIGTSVLLFFDPVIMDSVLYFPSSNNIWLNTKHPEKYWEKVRAQRPIAAQKMTVQNGELKFIPLPSFAQWSEPYLTHLTLDHLLDVQFCVDAERHRLYYNFLADSTIYWEDRITGEKGTMGVRGKYLDPNYPNPLSVTAEDWGKRARLFDASQKYLQLVYDAERHWLFRLYAGANPTTHAYDYTPDKLYIQVYDLATNEIIADAPFPFGKKIFRISDGQLWIDKHINPKGDYTIYKVGLGHVRTGE